MIIRLALSFALTLFIPLLYLIQLAVIFQFPYSFTAPANVMYLGLFLALSGVLVWIISLFQLHSSFGVLPQKQKRVTHGLYRYFKHPMYIGIWATFLGLSLALASWQGLFFLNVIMLPVLAIRASFEEKALI